MKETAVSPAIPRADSGNADQTPDIGLAHCPEQMFNTFGKCRPRFPGRFSANRPTDNVMPGNRFIQSLLIEDISDCRSQLLMSDGEPLRDREHSFYVVSSLIRLIE